MIRVLFVCLGNICRSPMAEAVFNHKVRTAGLSSQIKADSAGTGAWHVGNPPHQRVSRLLDEYGIPLNHRARQFEKADLDEFDYILVMDNQNLNDVFKYGAGTAKVSRLMEYAPLIGVQEVPDPYLTGRFEEVYRLVSEGSHGLLETIRSEHSI